MLSPNLILVLMVLLSWSVPSKATEDDDEELFKAWNYCSERSKSVEVLYENLDGEKILSKVHFHYDPDVSAAG